MQWRYRNVSARWVGLAFGAFVILIGAAGLGARGAGAWPVLLMAFGAVSIFTSLRRATVIVTAELVHFRGALRTRTYRVEEIERAEVPIGRTGPNGRGRQFLRLHVLDGDVADFGELNAPSPVAASEVGRAVGRINDVIGHLAEPPQPSA